MPTWTKEVVDLSVAGAALTIDNIKIDGTTIGHTDDTDLLTLASGALTIAGDTTITGDLVVSGNNLTFGNGEIISNGVDGSFQMFALGGTDSKLVLVGNNTQDIYYTVRDLGADKWNFGYDDSEGTFVIEAGVSGLGTSGQDFVLDAYGNLTLKGDLNSDGNIKVGGNIIKASDGGSTITLDTDDNVTILGDLAVTGGDITSSSGAISFGNENLSTTGNLVVGGVLDVDGTTNLDAVDIDGAVQLDGTFTVGVDGTGYDVKFFGATSGAYMLWDESADELEVYNADILCTSTNESNTTDPRVELYNDEISPAVDDSLGSVRWHGNNDADEKTLFGKVSYLSTTLTDSEENGEARFTVMNHGTQNVIWLRCEAQTSANTVKCTFPQNGGLVIGANGSKQGTLTLWDGGGGNTPGYLVLYSPNGTANYIFCEDDGTLKRHTSAPTANGDGSEIGGQS